MTERLRHGPGFAASLAGAVAGFLAGGILFAILAWPFALASWAALAVGTANTAERGGQIVLAALVLLLVQVLVTAWITQQVAGLAGDAWVPYGRSLGAVVLGAVATVVTAPALPADAALPLVGRSWSGLLVAAFVLSSGRPARASAATRR
ncbi:MAG TPA: hypothetical protein VFW80_11950 [Gaiellaceae bacterium]|nr:hypothetical protein [Gaiellaceae bacterium]